MPEITLFELGPTRSARVRWALLEAGLPFESAGNDVSIIGSDALKAVHPLGKLPAMLIDGEPLFESAAIVTAVADLVPEKALIAPPGSRNRQLHDQWLAFTLSELEAFLQSTEINSINFVIPESEHVPDIIPQNNRFFPQRCRRSEWCAGRRGLSGRQPVLRHRHLRGLCGELGTGTGPAGGVR